MGKLFLIKESSFKNAIFSYFDELFEPESLQSKYREMYDDVLDTYIENVDGKVFFKGGFDDDEVCFRWYSCDYFQKGSYAKTICPTVVIEDYYFKSLDGFFGDLWVEPFKLWFTSKFDLPVKTIEWW